MRAVFLRLLAFAILVAGPAIAEAQQPEKVSAQQVGKVHRIGLMTFNRAAGNLAPRDAFLQGLRDLGYVEGRNLVIESRDAEGKTERFPALAAELVALNVDVIVAMGGTRGALAAKAATTTVPIVFPAVGDPVADGIVSSLARPGGNVTGLAVLSPQLIAKSMDLLKQAVPGARRVALLIRPDSTPEHAKEQTMKGAEVAAQTLGMRLQVVEARTPDDFDRAFSDMVKARADALSVAVTPLFDAHRRRLVDLAARHRLPAVYAFGGSFVDVGGLMSYGPDYSDMFRRAAGYVDKILRGARPGDLPIEQPNKLELIINVKTAKALGLKIPRSLLLRADQVIQ